MKKVLFLFFAAIAWVINVKAQNIRVKPVKGERGVVVGVNVVNPMRASLADQNAAFNQLKAAGVKVIRCGITSDAKGIDYAKRAAANGLSIQIILSPQYLQAAPSRPYDPKNFPNMWSGHPLSYADPTLSKVYYQSLFEQLDKNGIILTGIELGNEINWAAFNPEFPLPGEGKILNIHDLYNDPEGKQIAKGFLQYLKILAVLKEVRDQSRLNRQAPIILAGLVSAPDGEKLYNNKKEDIVSLPGTIGFLQTNGLDTLVDAYGIHSYPWAGQPGNPAADGKRAARFTSVDIAECQPVGSKSGKPAWITEWGFNNTDQNCPINDTARTLLIKQMMGVFEKAAAQGRLAGVTYFAWNSDPWSKQPDPYSLYRCNGLTSGGKEAIKPLLAFALTVQHPVIAQHIAVGVNLINPYKLSIADQNTMLSKIKSAGVHVIRASITPNDAGIDFAQRAWNQGIQIEWMIYRFGGYDPFGHVPLSAADPKQFRNSFALILARLEAKGIKLTAFELGNEINLSGTNPEFPLPGKGIQLSLNDLYHDKEGQQIAKGYLQYLKILSVLKEIRDQSKLNQHTPILTAGLGNYEQADGPLPNRPKGDIVSINSTIEYMRAHGLDSLVDGYAVHIYPWGNGPGDASAAAGRKTRLENFDLQECKPIDSKGGKPCWITEWGFNNTDMNCPINDTNRIALVREMMNNYRPYVRQGQLVGLFYFFMEQRPFIKKHFAGKYLSLRHAYGKRKISNRHNIIKIMGT